MRKLCDYFEMLKDHPEKMEEAEEVACEALQFIKIMCPTLYKDTCYRLHCIVFGEHFDDELASHAVSEMKNADGSVGGHWSRSDTDSLANRMDITDKADFYYVINMLWSDYCTVLGSDPNTYAKMAKAYIEDVDAEKGQPFRIFVHK